MCQAVTRKNCTIRNVDFLLFLWGHLLWLQETYDSWSTGEPFIFACTGNDLPFFKLLLTSIPSSNQIVILRRVVYKNGLTLTMTLQLRTAKCLLLIWKKYVLYSNEVGEGEVSKVENIYASKESVSKVPFSTLWNTKQILSPLHSYILGNSNRQEENTWAMY